MNQEIKLAQEKFFETKKHLESLMNELQKKQENLEISQTGLNLIF